MSPDCTDLARSHFHSKTRALRDGDVLVLERGELTMIAEAVGRSLSHVYRTITGERPSPPLQRAIEDVVGCPMARIHLPPATRSVA